MLGNAVALSVQRNGIWAKCEGSRWQVAEKKEYFRKREQTCKEPEVGSCVMCHKNKERGNVAGVD